MIPLPEPNTVVALVLILPLVVVAFYGPARRRCLAAYRGEKGE